MVEIIFNEAIQPQNRIEISKYLNPWLWLVPAWCSRIIINLWDSTEDSESLADVIVSYEYRKITISFYTCWLDRPERERQRAVVHELVHGFVAIIANYSRDTFDTLCMGNENDKLNKHVKEELTQRHEAATEDLANVIFEKFK